MGNFEQREDSETTVVPLPPKPMRALPVERPTLASRGLRSLQPVFNAIRSLGHAAAARRATQRGSSRQPPDWVVGYLLLCAALTVIGLIVLVFEHRMLGP